MPIESVSNVTSLTIGEAGGSPSGGAKKSSSASGSSSSGKVYDPRDTNQDGKVSLEEELAYDLKHPQEATQNSATATNDSNGSQLDVTA
jgi:hypothetical protein